MSSPKSTAMDANMEIRSVSRTSSAPPSPHSTQQPNAHDDVTSPNPAGQTRPASSPVRMARWAGVLYLVVAVLGTFAQVVRVRMYAPNDTDTTTANIVANASLMRLSFVADLVQALVWLVFAMVIYQLFEHAGKALARATLAFIMVSAGMAMTNMVHQLGAVLVATNPAYASTLGTQGSHGMVLLLMDLQHYGYLIAQMSWLWLFTLGLLAYRSRMFPRPLAVLMMLGTISYVTDALLQFLSPDFARTMTTVLIVPMILSEVALLAYLLIKGVRIPTTLTQTPTTT